MSNTFSSQIFAEKLSKLSNTQQSIETLSHWCVDYRKKAREIVETWENLFKSSPFEQRISFLYLANDILQNSRRKGSEFVNEFWKVLPGALKSVCEDGDDRGKNAVMRLVGIWDERKVFGSRGRGLKDDIFGKTPFMPPMDDGGKSSNPIKLVRKDAHSVRIKLAVGGAVEKIVTSYQSVLDEHFKEDTALNKCKATVSHVGKMEKDVDHACTQGIQQGSPLLNEVEEQETILKQCVEQLVSVEATRAVLISNLKEALQEQESKMELIRTQLQVAQAETERAITMKQRLVSAMLSTVRGPSPNSNMTSLPSETTLVSETNPPSVPFRPPFSFPSYMRAPQPQLPQPPTRFSNSSSSPPQPRLQLPFSTTSLMNSISAPLPVTSFTSAEEQNKRAAAAVAAKLTASSSSAQMLSSVLSSLAAEEAASKNGGLGLGVFTSSPSMYPVDKRPRLDVPDGSNAFFRHLQPHQLASQSQVLAASTQQMDQQRPPPLPPLPPPPNQQYAHSHGAMPYSFVGSSSQPPLPPVPPPQQQQQLSSMMGYFPPPGFGFYRAPAPVPAPEGSST